MTDLDFPHELRPTADSNLDLAAVLADTVTPIDPPERVRAKLLELVHAIVLRDSEAQWEPSTVPGRFQRILFKDRENRRLTRIVRLDPGARLPAHRHAGVEEILMLTGDLRCVDGTVLLPGDYQRSAAGSYHAELWSEQGCTALLISLLREAA